MAEKLGEIYYEVDLETAQLIEANQKVRKELDEMGDQSKGAAAGLKTLETQMKSSATAVNRATTAGAGFRSTFQQAGYQIQDFIVQVQGGQSALVAFSQQGSQLAGAFGPGGAMVGALIALGSVLTGVLMSALGSTSNEMDKLGKAADALNKIVVINSQGVAALSNDYARLAVTNATLAAQLRDNAIANYEIAVRDAGKAIQGVVKEQSSWFGSLQGGSASVSALGDVLSTLNIETNSFREAFSEASKTGLGANTMANTLTATVSMLGDQFAIGDDAAFGLAKRLNEVAKNPSPQAISSLVDYMNSLTPTTKSGADAMVDLETKVLAAGAAMQKAQDDSEALKNRLKELRTEAQQANFDSVSKQLEAQRISLTQGALAAKIYAINNMDLTQSQKDQLIAAVKVVDHAERDKKAKDDAASAAKRMATAQGSITQKLEALRQKSEVTASSTGELSREMAILQAQQSLGKGATTEQIRLAGEYGAKIWDNANALKAQAAAEKLKAETEQAGRFSDQQKAAADVAVNPYTGEATNPAAQVELEQKQKLAAVAKYEAMGAMTEQQAQDTRTAIVKQGAYARMQIVKDEAQKQVDSMNTMLGGFQAGFEGLANIIARGAGESSSAYKALFAVSKGFAIAQAGLNLQLAISNAMASGPFPWNLANMAQVAAAGGQVVSAIGGASYGGAREHGGPVNANSMYRVGEGGKPEIFKASNGSQYMIPGDSGKVISNSDLGGAGSDGGGTVFNVAFNIHTTNGIDDATMQKMAGMMKQVALYQMKDQTRPGGILGPRK